VSVLFAAFLGYNPIENLVGSHALAALSPANHAALTGRSFFPHLISAPFSTGLHEAFLFAIVACLIAAAASLLRGGKYAHADAPAASSPGESTDSQRVGNGNGHVVAGDVVPSVAQITTAEEQHAR
jgi:hypothetical protein